MFLARRSAQAEYFDDPERSFAEVAEGFRQLRRVNRLFRFADPFQRLLSRWLGAEDCRKLSVLDLGAGDGSLGHELTTWAARRGWIWRVTSLDLSPRGLRLNPQSFSVAGSAVALPFRDQSFDVVIASQMTHHLPDDAAVVQHFREAWRVTRDAIFLNDLHRNLALVALVWLGAHATRLSPEMRADGLLSVRRGWRVQEWQALAARAEIPNAEIRLYLGTRIMLQARKRDR
jgi:2-polyprenyl-3-methyl-5-hydroxy-6-metoxy-1,4-benzoquinol methylase